MTDRETVRAGYDQLGRTYADHRSLDSAERAFLELTLADAPADPRLLDAGCGPGLTLAELADRAEPVGLDLSGEQLAIAAETAPTAALVRGDLASLPFGPDTFDAIVSLGALMHLPAAGQETAIGEFARVLGPGGRLLVSDGEGVWAGENPDWLGAGVTMTWEIAGIDAVTAELEAVGFEVLDRTTAADELAEADDARQALVLAELTP